MRKIIAFVAFVALAGFADTRPSKPAWDLTLGCIPATACGMACGQETFAATRYQATATGWQEMGKYVCWRTKP